MRQREELRLRREIRLAETLAAHEGWKWHVEACREHLHAREGGVASNRTGSLDEIRYEQGFIAGIRWVLEQPELAVVEAERGLEQLDEGDDDE